MTFLVFFQENIGDEETICYKCVHETTTEERRIMRTSKWNDEDRRKLLALLDKGVPEQEIREALGRDGKPMTSNEFASQLKRAMVETGRIKQSSKGRKKEGKKRVYEVTKKGRLTIVDFEDLTGHGPGEKFVLEKPRGRSKAWKLVPAE